MVLYIRLDIFEHILLLLHIILKSYRLGRFRPGFLTQKMKSNGYKFEVSCLFNYQQIREINLSCHVCDRSSHIEIVFNYF